MAVYFWYGEEDFNIDLEVNKLRSKLNKDFASMNYQIYKSPEYQDLISALRTPPMMFGNMLIIIDAYRYFFKLGRKEEIKFEDKQLDEIENALKNCTETIDIVFVVKLPRDDRKKIDNRRKLFKILTSFQTQEFPVFPSYKTDEISGWIKKQGKKKEITLTDDAIKLLIDNIGNNLRQFDMELDKLKLIAYPEKNITKNMVNELAFANQDIFNITDYLLDSRKDCALLEFKNLCTKRHPLEILATLQTMLKKWITAKTCTPSDIYKLTGLPQATQIKLKKIPLSEIVKLKQNLYEVEYKIKYGEVINDIAEVELAFIR